MLTGRRLYRNELWGEGETTFKSPTGVCVNCLNQAIADEKTVGGADVTNKLYNAMAASSIDPDLDGQEAVEN